MADVRELPDHVREFISMSKDYMRQETLEPAKQLGKFGGFVVAAAFCFALAALFLSIASVRIISELLPDGPNWSALAYVLTALLLGVVAAVLIAATSRSTSSEGS